MKPDDAHGLLPPDRRPFRVLIIAGSNRHQYNCPRVDGKARTWRVAWLIDCRRTGRSISRISANVFGRARIQSCNVCLHVDGPLRLAVQLLRRRQCGGARPDVRPRPLRPPGPRGCVARLGPINWYASSSNLKLMFDRLVCMNSGNLREDRIADKDPELARQMEQECFRRRAIVAITLRHPVPRPAGLPIRGR